MNEAITDPLLLIKAGLQRLQHRLNPSLSEEAVRKFESEHRIKLPQEYRMFLIQLGNGGPGPAYGLFRLGEAVLYRDVKPYGELEGLVGDLSKQFSHDQAWNDRTGEAKYWESVDGAIPISDIGCGSRFWLVINGPEAGNVWCDERCDFGPFLPMEQTFFQWYCEWLKGELARHDISNPTP